MPVVSKEEKFYKQNKKGVSTKAKTSVTINAAELSSDNDLSASNKVDGPTASFKNKPVTKLINKKITANTRAIEIGETVLSNSENSLPNKNENEIVSANEKPSAKEKTTTVTLAETKKQDSIFKVNKTAIIPPATPAKKPIIKKHSLFADISIMPFLPVQQGNTAAMLTRRSFNNDVLSEFKSTSINTTLEPSVAFQLAVRKNISNRWQAGAGFQYAQVKQTIRITGEEITTVYSTVERLAIDTGRSYLMTDTVETITKGTREINAVNSYWLISVPLFAQYHAGKLLGCNISFTGGLFFNVYNHYSNSINPIITSTANQNNNKLGVDIYGGLRLSKLYGRKIELFAEPTARLNINQANTKNALLHKQIRQAGIAFGAAFKLN